MWIVYLNEQSMILTIWCNIEINCMREMALYHWIQIPCKLSNRVYIDKRILCATLIFDVELLVNPDKLMDRPKIKR